MSPITVLRDRMLDPQQTVILYGTTPPRAGTAPEAVIKAATKLAERAKQLPLDGLVVYDVQDEAQRTSEPRPFPFIPTLEPRVYAKLLQDLTGLITMSYKSVGALTEAGWADWLDETSQAYGIQAISLVGSSVPNPPPDALLVDRALQIAAAHPAGYLLGGVVIAERHSPSYNECQRLLHKTAQGCRYFISQVVYQATPSIVLLNDYLTTCRELGVAPQRIVFTFSPCGRPKTMEFLKWLGVAIDPITEQQILNDPMPFQKSIQICCEQLRRVLDQPYLGQIPLGVNIESVSIHKDEIAASVELVHALREVLREYRLI